MASRRQWWCVIVIAAVAVTMTGGGLLRAAEVIPAVPLRYFNDYALTVKPETANKLNAELEDFERQTSTQILVAIYSQLQTDSDLADYCQRVARSWKVGEKGQRNGAVLFVFVREHKMNIQVGYGLEGALPDATCEDILADKVRPSFKANDYDGGLTAGVEAMMQAVKGEYKGSGRTDYEKKNPGGKDDGPFPWGTLIFFIVLAFMVSRAFGRRGGMMYTGGGPTFFGGGFGGGSSSSGGGGGGSSGGGFFSAGGGDFGGGGASSDW